MLQRSLSGALQIASAEAGGEWGSFPITRALLASWLKVSAVLGSCHVLQHGTELAPARPGGGRRGTATCLAAAHTGMTLIF